MRRFLKSLWPQFAIAVSSSAVQSGYLLAGISPPEPGRQLWGSFFWLTVLVWIQNDAKLRQRTPCYDFGFLLWMTAFVSVPWYLCSSSGFKRGALLLLLFLLLSVFPDYVMLIVWDALYG